MPAPSKLRAAVTRGPEPWPNSEPGNICLTHTDCTASCVGSGLHPLARFGKKLGLIRAFLLIRLPAVVSNLGDPRDGTDTWTLSR